MKRGNSAGTVGGGLPYTRPGPLGEAPVGEAETLIMDVNGAAGARRSVVRRRATEATAR
ncbi:hypothetical protein H4W31_004315 [Plantactinospora soyae]|uniref:Uncharacterized protein n=1 Tax=Plantactinospora soyae TaxID=1544732 RepID=A0A927M620_9ACTN|nr:hypothetical protein [Plantactinospora soyae]